MNNKRSVGETVLCIAMVVVAVVVIGLCIWFNMDKTSDIKDAASTSMVEAVENDGVTETELDGDTDINWVKDESFDILDENPRQYIHGLVYPEYPSDSKLDIKTSEAEEETNDDAAVVEEEATEDTEEATEVEEEATEDTEEATETNGYIIEWQAGGAYEESGIFAPSHCIVDSVEFCTVYDVDCIKVTWQMDVDVVEAPDAYAPVYIYNPEAYQNSIMVYPESCDGIGTMVLNGGSWKFSYCYPVNDYSDFVIFYGYDSADHTQTQGEVDIHFEEV